MNPSQKSKFIIANLPFVANIGDIEKGKKSKSEFSFFIYVSLVLAFILAVLYYTTRIVLSRGEILELGLGGFLIIAFTFLLVYTGLLRRNR